VVRYRFANRETDLNELRHTDAAMRTTFVIALTLGLALGAAASGANQTAAGKATLKLQGGAPLTLRGAGFVSAERVVVSVRSGQRQSKRVTANGRGGFVVSFRRISYDRCDPLYALAVGSRGSRAALKMLPRLCPPSL
jgi:hypothetical protein